MKWVLELIEKFKGKTDNNGKTALHLAAEYGHEEAVRVLLDNDAYIEAKDSKGWTAIRLAAKEGWVKVCTGTTQAQRGY